MKCIDCKFWDRENIFIVFDDLVSTCSLDNTDTLSYEGCDKFLDKV